MDKDEDVINEEDMGNQQANGVFQEEAEPKLQVDESSYMIRSVISNNHTSDTLGRPVVVFDRWEMLRSDMKTRTSDEPNENKVKTFFKVSDEESAASSSYEELSQCNMSHQLSEGIQRNHMEGTIQLASPTSHCKGNLVFAKNTLSLGTLNDKVARSSASDQEVEVTIRCPPVIERAASVDTLSNLPAKKPESLQQRRNKRPTSLQIPSIIDIPPAVEERTSRIEFTSCDSHRPVTRQRSHSMPSTVLLELREEITPKRPTLDQALSLINKKKLSKADIDEQSLLHRAADAGHLILLKKCIKAGCSLNKRLDMLNGTTALHCAVRADQNSTQTTRTLLEAGIDVNATNDLGETAIFSAIIHKHLECVDLLVEHGCDLSLVWQDSTPLYLTLHNRNLETSCKVIKNGAKITHLPDYIQQPLHAVLDLCCSHEMTYNNIQLLRAVVQADGNVVQHLHSYSGSTPGCSQQDIIRQIYSMPPGPEQDEGKRLIRSLIKLGYSPSRGELSFMSEADNDYDYLYSYIKSSPVPLKDLCIRAVRKECKLNVSYAVEKWPQVQSTQREKAQILLVPTPEPEPDYENVVVLRNNKEKSKEKGHRKSLKSFVNGFQRLSRRFSKKNRNKNNDSMQLSVLPLATEELTLREKSESLPSGLDNTDTTNNNKPRFLKRQSKKKPDISVRDIVKRYSNSDRNLAGTSDEAEDLINGNTELLDNQAFDSGPNQSESPEVSYTSRIEIQEEDVDVTTPFENVGVKTAPFYNQVQTLDRNYKYSNPQSVRNPLGDKEANVLSYGVFRSSITVGEDC